MRRSLFVVAAIAALVSPGCRHEAKALTASCDGKTICIDYYVTAEPIVKAACARRGTWREGQPCDRSRAVVGCNHGDSVEWFDKTDADTVESVKAYAARLCGESGDRGLVPPTWKR